MAIIIVLGIVVHADASAPLKQKIRAGVFNFDGYHMKDDLGRLSGYGIDLLRLISENSHLDFIFSGYDKSWQEMIEMLKNGELDVVTSARRTPAREEIFAFSLPVGRNYTVLSTQSNNTAIRGGDYPSYDGMVIGILEGSSQNRHLEDFASAKGFHYQVKTYNTPRELTRALQDGAVDAILSSNLRKSSNEKLLDVINADNFYAIARKENQELIDEINYALEQMNINEGDWENDLFYRHYGPTNNTTPTLTSRERDYISGARSKGKKIQGASRPDRPPYSYLEDGKMKGILPDFFGRVMEFAGLEYEVVPKGKANSQTDVILDSAFPVELREGDGFSGFSTPPYMSSGLARVMRQDFQGVLKNIAVVADSLSSSDLFVPEGANAIEYPTTQKALDSVKAGETDAALIFPYAAQVYMNDNDPENILYYTMMDDPGAQFRFFVPASADHELISILNKGIKAVPEGTLNHLATQYTTVSLAKMSMGHYLRAHPGIAFGGMFATLSALGLFVLLFMRSTWNRRLLDAKENANRYLEEQLSIVQALSRDYTNVFAVNPCEGAIKVVKYQNNLGIPEEDIEGGPWDGLVENYAQTKAHPDDREWLAKNLVLGKVVDKLAKQGEYTGIYRVNYGDGVTHHIQFTFVDVFNPTLKENFILAGFRNIDEMFKREQEQKRRLSEALEKARYASEAKTAFLNSMSHDIRTPMNAIIGFASLASSHAQNINQVKNYLGKIMTSGNHLLSLINDVLDMSRIESGKVQIEEKENSLPEILHDLGAIVQADVKARQLDFQMDSLNVVNESIVCDRLRLNQVLLNILGNAIKYTPAGGAVALHVIQKAPAKSGKAPFEFRVRDTGIGMSKEFLEHVFEPFEREQSSTVSGIQGTGLGLAITKKLVDMMGGALAVESELEKGTEFILTLDFRIPGQQSRTIALPAKFAGMRALVAGADVNACAGISKMLTELGLRADITTPGNGMLERAKMALEEKAPYAMIFIDCIKVDDHVIEDVRALGTIIGDVPQVILLSSYEWGDQEAKAREAGVTAFCAKPVFLSQLAAIIDAPAETGAADVQNRHKSPLFGGKRILLAEDNEMNQEIAQMILEDAGFEVDIVENGLQALERIKAKPPQFYDLVLMDVQMPVMDGYAATRQIRGLPDQIRAAIPVIAMTANAFNEDRLAALEAGMNGHVPKPIDIQLLMDALEKILGKMKSDDSGAKAGPVICRQ